jgi:hypothetical protein
MVLRLLGSTLLGAIAASILLDDRLPIRLWVIGAVVAGLVRIVGEVRSQRATAALARAAGRRLARLEARVDDGAIDGDDTELVTFESLQQAAEMLGLAAMVNDQWLRDEDLDADIRVLQERIDGFRTTDDAVADLAEAWAIEARCEDCARTAVQLHRGGTV